MASSRWPKWTSKLLRDQLKCQKRIGKALSYYVGKKLLYLIKGKTRPKPKPKPIKQLDKLAEFCDVPVGQDTGTGLVLPGSGRNAPPRSASLPERWIRWRCAAACVSSARCGSTVSVRTRSRSGRTSSSS